MATLMECVECSRHVRSTEETCPFCGASTAAARPREAPPTPSDRLAARAAVMLAGAATVVACGKQPADPPPPTPPAPTDMAAPAYGVPPMDIPAPGADAGAPLEQPQVAPGDAGAKK